MAALAIVVIVIGKSRSQSKRITAKVVIGPVIDAVYGIGTVTASKTYQLKLGIASSLRNLFVHEGDLVREGAPLVQLEGVALFRAPFQGTITSIPFKQGESVFPQVPILTLTDLRDRYLVVTLEQQAAIRVEKGLLSVATFESLKDQQFKGTVRTIFSNDSLFVVHVDVKGLPDRVLPGMTADIAIQIGKRDQVKLVPIAALNNGKVLKVATGRTIEIPVEVGAIDGALAEVRSNDLSADDLVVVGAKP